MPASLSRKWRPDTHGMAFDSLILSSAQADNAIGPKKKLRFDEELVRVAFKPWRLGFPIR